MIKRAQSMRTPSETPLPEAIRTRLDTIISEGDAPAAHRATAPRPRGEAAEQDSGAAGSRPNSPRRPDRSLRRTVAGIDPRATTAVVADDVRRNRRIRRRIDALHRAGAAGRVAIRAGQRDARDPARRGVPGRVCVRVVSAATVRFRTARRQNVTRRHAADFGRTAADAAGGAGRLSGCAVGRAADPGPARDRADGAHPVAVSRSGAATGAFTRSPARCCSNGSRPRSRATSCCSVSVLLLLSIVAIALFTWLRSLTPRYPPRSRTISVSVRAPADRGCDRPLDAEPLVHGARQCRSRSVAADHRRARRGTRGGGVRGGTGARRNRAPRRAFAEGPRNTLRSDARIHDPESRTAHRGDRRGRVVVHLPA